jgi:hypothetical protein
MVAEKDLNGYVKGYHCTDESVDKLRDKICTLG